jgi:hypothetical protein
MALTLDAANGVIPPIWTTATRPSNPNAGQIGFNSTLNLIEVYNGTRWVTVGDRALIFGYNSIFGT